MFYFGRLIQVQRDVPLWVHNLGHADHTLSDRAEGSSEYYTSRIMVFVFIIWINATLLDFSYASV